MKEPFTISVPGWVLRRYTTFSSFSLQTLNFANDGEFYYAAMNIAASVILCLAAVWAGSSVAAEINAVQWE